MAAISTAQQRILIWARRPMLSHCVSQQASVCFTTANAVVNGRQSHSRRLESSQRSE